ncbi:hypothetical protein, partial [Cellulomonas marina]|uniref:hypothetical protein n=1 Tax=Cellulomonas marina TaxID=988821 RepID=UPI001113790D
MLSFAERLVAADASRSEGQPWWTSPLHPAVLELPAGRAWPALPDEAPGAREVSVQDVLSLLPGRAHTMGTGGSRAVLGPEVPAALLQLGVPVEVVKRVPGARARLEAQAESVLTALENVERMWRSVSAARAELIAQAFAWQMLQGRLVEGSLADDG